MKEYKKELMVSVRAILCFSLLTGLLYPVSVTLMGRLLFEEKASGSLISKGDHIVGSKLLAQPFSQERYFWPRPSAVKYDAASSGATNLSPNSAGLVNAVHALEAAGAVLEMRFMSASGLDPDISPEAARAQIGRVSKARGLNQDQVKALELLVENRTEERQFGFLGQPRVNVLQLNLATDDILDNE